MVPTGRQEKSAMRKMFIRMTCLLACDILKREKRRRVLYKFKEKLTTSKDGLSMQIENEIEHAARKIISSNYQIGLAQEDLDDAVNRAKEALKLVSWISQGRIISSYAGWTYSPRLSVF